MEESNSEISHRNHTTTTTDDSVKYTVEDKKPTATDKKKKEKTVEELSAEEIKIADYQKKYSFAERFADSIECKSRHSDCVPLIIERAKDFKDIKDIENGKFLFNARSQTAQAMVRAQKDVQAKQMWFYVHMKDNSLKMIYPQSQLGVLYQRYGRSDGNLYIFYSDKNLVQTTSTFMTVMQILTGVLLVIYGYLYFFGVDDILKLFGYVRYLPESPTTNPNNSNE